MFLKDFNFYTFFFSPGFAIYHLQAFVTWYFRDVLPFDISLCKCPSILEARWERLNRFQILLSKQAYLCHRADKLVSHQELALKFGKKS